MRRLAAALLTTTLLLAGCSSDDGSEEPTATPGPGETAAGENPDAPPTSSATPEDIAALEGVTVEGDPGAAPTVTFDQPFEVANHVALVETEGTGADLEEGQGLEVQYLVLSGDDGSELLSTWTEDRTEKLTLGDPRLVPALNEALTGQKVGTRVLFGAPGAAATAEAEAVPATVRVIDVIDARDVPTRAEGTPVEPPAGLPTVTLAENGAPAIDIPADYAEPTELVAQTLIEGEGPVVEQGQTLTAHYTGWLVDGTQFDSSWERGAPSDFPIGVGQVVVGWDEGLVGQKVGSQVLLVIPAEKGYGERGQGETIPPDATLVFVVDILDAA